MKEMLLQLHARAVAAGLAGGSFRRSERGQGALEYMAIIVGLIIVVAVLFILFGDTLYRKGCEEISRILQADLGCPQSPRR